MKITNKETFWNFLIYNQIEAKIQGRKQEIPYIIASSVY